MRRATLQNLAFLQLVVAERVRRASTGSSAAARARATGRSEIGRGAFRSGSASSACTACTLETGFMSLLVHITRLVSFYLTAAPNQPVLLSLYRIIMPEPDSVTILKVGEYLAVAGFNDGWAPLADLDSFLAARVTEAFRKDGPGGFRDISGLTCRSLAFAPGTLLVCVLPPGPRTGFGVYGFWTGTAWHTLDRKSTRSGSAFRELQPRLAESVDALDLLMFYSLFADWEKPPIRILVTPRDLAVTRGPAGTAPGGGVPAVYDSLSRDELAALCVGASIQPFETAGLWQVRAHAQSGAEIFSGAWDVWSDLTVVERRWEPVVTDIPVDESLQGRTPDSVGEIVAALHMDSIRNHAPKRLVPKGLRGWIGIARWFFWDVLVLILVGVPLLLAWWAFRWAGSLLIAPALIVAGRPEDLHENIPLRWRSTRRRRLATCIGWAGLLATVLVFASERAALAAAAVAGATVLLASAAFAWNEAERYRLAKTLKRDDGLLSRLPDTAIEFSALTLLAIGILPLVVHRLGLAFPSHVPVLGPTVGSAYDLVGRAILLALVAPLRDWGVPIPIAEVSGPTGQLAGRLGLAVNLFVSVLLTERISMRRTLRSEAMARLQNNDSVSSVVALGMYASRPLRRAMKRSRREDIRGRAALGLALIGDRGALPLIDTLHATEVSAGLRNTLAVAAALLGGRHYFPESVDAAVLRPTQLETDQEVNLWSAALALVDPTVRPQHAPDLRQLLKIPNASLDLKWQAAMALANLPDEWSVDDVLSWTAIFVSDEWYGTVPQRLRTLGYLLNRREFWSVFDRLVECMVGAGPLDRPRAAKLFLAWMRDRLWNCGDDGAATLVVTEIQRYVARNFSSFPPSATTVWAKAKWLRSAVLGVFTIGICGQIVIGLDMAKPRRRAPVPVPAHG